MTEPFTHRVLPYDGMDDYLAGALPFLRDGIDSGDRVIVVTPPAGELLLRDALGPAAGAVEFTESSRWYAHPCRTLSDCLGQAEALAWQGRRLRLLGEPAWTGRDPLEVLEWQRVEALVNVAFSGTGASLLCAYARGLPPGVVAASHRTHPETLKGDKALANPRYMDPWAYSAECDRAPLNDPPAGAETLPVDLPDLYWVRQWVVDCARRVPLGGDGLQRLLVAVTEVVTNAMRHGHPPIVLRMWADPADRSLVCQVTDAGRWAPGADPGLIPPRYGGPGMFGLWAVRLLCSIVQIRTDDHGTTVRLRFRLPAPGGGSAPARPSTDVNTA
ncbi:anti-sigma factor RsbA family regulatory protein [Actinomadura rugatobispora]|uniref:Anti-sigma factor RsbA family regulatory protein n=1 Tax=Actinomadura rugatobispora TaxID=1994 RepID=A0ABW1A2M5_9ACTN